MRAVVATRRFVADVHFVTSKNIHFSQSRVHATIGARADIAILELPAPPVLVDSIRALNCKQLLLDRYIRRVC